MRFPPSSTALQHYIDLVGLETRPFPNPLAEATPSTVVDLKGESHYATTVDDLPQVYRDVMHAWNACLEEGADFSDMNRAMRERDVPRIREIWSELVEKLDNQTFYGFLCDSESFKSFRHREIFGQVGFGTGAGTPTSRTRSSKSCASSTPRPTTTTAASSAAPSNSRSASGTASRRRSSTGPTAPRWRPCTWAAHPAPP